MTTRRALFIALGVATLAPGVVLPQAKKQPVPIGWLSLGSRESGLRYLYAFREELATLGWKGESQIHIEERWAEGQEDRLVSLTRELVAKKPALFVATGLRAVISTNKEAPKIPIVMLSNNDPIAAGLVTSLARPGGVITGLSGFNVDISGKFLEFLLPGGAEGQARRVSCLLEQPQSHEDRRGRTPRCEALFRGSSLRRSEEF